MLPNFSLQGEDIVLKHWTQLISFKNGVQGVIACIDEMQNRFSSDQSKVFPSEMLEAITQNRRVILGTSQSFNRLSKPIREQAAKVRKWFTLFHRVTFVHCQLPELDSKGDVIAGRALAGTASSMRRSRAILMTLTQ